jgi:hypothetical protein
MFAALRLPARRKTAAFVFAALLATLWVSWASMAVKEFRRLSSPVYRQSNPLSHLSMQFKVLEPLQKIGLKPGDSIAIIGNPFESAMWARLLRVRIISEIPMHEVSRFWVLDEKTKDRVLSLLMSTGARLIVAESLPPAYPFLHEWRQIPDTKYYLYKGSRLLNK